MKANRFRKKKTKFVVVSLDLSHLNGDRCRINTSQSFWNICICMRGRHGTQNVDLCYFAAGRVCLFCVFNFQVQCLLSDCHGLNMLDKSHEYTTNPTKFNKKKKAHAMN